jgi:hypothetical protein
MGWQTVRKCENTRTESHGAHHCMTSAQAGTGKNYTKSDFDVLYGRWLDVLKQCDPNTMKSFADAPIVVTDKAIQDRLNTKMVSVFASDTDQEKQVYHS